MPYVKRNTENKIVQVSSSQDDAFVEYLDADAPELLEFVQQISEYPRVKLTKSDTEVARIFEDLVDVLINKGIIHFTDLPQDAQKKLISRQKMRQAITNPYIDIDSSDDSIKLG